MEVIARLSSSLWPGLAEWPRSRWGGARRAKAESWVWYIEARPFNQVAGQPGEVPEVAPVMGSGVAVRLEHLERITGPGGEYWAPKNQPEIRKYLLTCAHVVRGFRPASGGWNPLLGEILCWGPKSRYLHWQAGNHRRLSGQADPIGAHRAELKLAPIVAAGTVHSEDATPANDWVLLEVFDGPLGEFDHMPAIETWREIGEDSRDLSVIGYPGGALSWSNNQEVIPHGSTGFGVKRVGPGGLSLTGVDETSPGMSGGGVFDQRGALVGLHRAVNDGAMERHAVPVAVIRQWLEERGMRPAPAPARSPWWRNGGITRLFPSSTTLVIVLAVLLCLTLGLWLVPATFPASYCLEVKGAEDPPDAPGAVFLKPVAGLQLELVPQEWSLPGSAQVVTDGSGKACFRLDLPRALLRRETLFFNIRCLNAPGALGPLSPLLLEPYGITGDDLRRSSEDLLPLRGLENRGHRSFIVLSENTWLASRLSKQISESKNGLEQIIRADVQKASAELKLSSVQADKSVRAWADILRLERPVLPTSQLSVGDSGAILRVAAAVGALHEGGNWVGTGFAISPKAVVALGVCSDSRHYWISFGEKESDSFERVELGRSLWRGISNNLCLFEAKGKLPRSPALGRIRPADLTPGREVYVIGYPGQDPRAPPEIGSIFPVGQRSVMFGQILLTDESDSVISRIFHDATTTGGTATGPLVDRKTNKVIGVHVGGSFDGMFKQNYAISVDALLSDTEFRNAAFGSDPEPEVSYLSPEPGPTDPLRLGSDSPLTSGYDPLFLGVPLPLPESVDGADHGFLSHRLDYMRYSVVMNKDRRIARLAAANLDRGRLTLAPNRMDLWRLDPRLPADSQPSKALFEGNDLDRGHLISPRFLTWGAPEVAKLASLSAFYYPNATPQHTFFNRHTWTKLEDRVYDLLQPESQRLSVFAGPVEDDGDLRYRGYRIPRRFWMVAAYEDKANPSSPVVHAFLAEQYVPGASSDPDEWPQLDATREVSIDIIESIAKIKFQLTKNAVFGHQQKVLP